MIFHKQVLIYFLLIKCTVIGKPIKFKELSFHCAIKSNNDGFSDSPNENFPMHPYFLYGNTILAIVHGANLQHDCQQEIPKTM